MSFSWIVYESRTSWVERFPVDILPETLDPAIRILTKKNAVGFEVGGIAGSIPLNNGDTLHIIPKIGTCNFIRMMLTADGLYDESRRIFKELSKYSSSQDRTEALIARALIEQLRAISAHSRLSGRTRTQIHTSTAQGRIRIPETHYRSALRKREPFNCDVRVRNDDIPENRVLAAASQIAARFLPTHLLVDTDQYLLNQWNTIGLNAPLHNSDIEIVKENLRRVRYTGSRGYYKNALTVALMLLGIGGIAQGKYAQIRGEGFIIHTAAIFERYVRVLVSNYFKPKGCSVIKGGRTAEYLYLGQDRLLDPDIVVYRGNALLCVADAKYKEPDAKDHYQLFSYLTTLGASHGFFLSPAFQSVVTKKNPSRTLSGKSVHTFSLPLSDLDETERALKDELDTLNL